MRNIIVVSRIFIVIFLRDKLNLFFSFFFNAFLMVMLGFYVSNRFDVGTIGIYDDLKSDFSNQFIKTLGNDPAIKVKKFNDTAALFKAIEKGGIVAGIKIDKPFEALKDDSVADPISKHKQLQIYGSSENMMWVKMLEPGIKIAILNTNNTSKKIISQINLKTQTVQSRNINYFKSIFPGVLVFSVMGLSFTGAMSLLYFRKSDVLKRLKITPLKKYEFLIGFITSYFILLLLQAILYIFIAWLVFGYVFTGNYLQISLLIVSCGLLFILLGITIANIVPSIDSGNNIIRFLNFPASFLCGVFIPIETLPKILQYISVFHPLTYFTSAMHNAVNYNSAFSGNSTNYIIIFILMIVFSVISIKTFKWEAQS
ncbi:MAG: ABC transporter permease [Chryseobacterium sp.]|uniref:ABC transporter permease n=1 Tax=Chryseobacterium sp. TaxID=1871047 RepID=UPI0025BE7402|nr:ABC transporter permease [Chryseobacterium sp.]MCJ7934775.1 ABC transporter permease [Chryseobacterium sp.]